MNKVAVTNIKCSPDYQQHTNPSTHGNTLNGKGGRSCFNGIREGRKRKKRNKPENGKSQKLFVVESARQSGDGEEKDHIVKSIMALTMSFSHLFSAFTALLLLQLACCITNSMSFASTPSSSTSSSDSSSTGAMTLVGSAI